MIYFRIIRKLKKIIFLFSYGDISAATMFQDIGKICIGNIVVFFYMTMILSKFGWTELRVSI